MMCDLSLAGNYGAINATADNSPCRRCSPRTGSPHCCHCQRECLKKQNGRWEILSGLHTRAGVVYMCVCVWVLAIVTVLQNFEWKPEENNGVNESIYAVTPKYLEKEKEAMKERGREGQKAGTGEGESQSRQTNAKIHTAHTNSFSAIAQPVQCPPDHPKHTHKHWS